ncbi:MAG: tryptophan--tRNA ligase [Terracidiphilus sp.]
MHGTPTPSSRPRVLSGMRPTGKLHLGNYMGALANWVKLQDSYECYFFIADWHALTTDYADPSRLKLNTLDVALDWLAAGLDPQKSTIFIQSHVPQHAELHLLFSMITPLGWLERVPTYKEQQENITGKDLSTYGFLGYPLLQAADILLYQPQFVPVGQDQVAHVELTREVARRFNSMYKTAVFPEPDALLTPSPKLPGTDGRKMSKSYGNTIGLTEEPSLIAEKILGMSTNGQRPRQSDPGDPDLCPVGDLHKVFSTPSVIAETQAGCRSASIGCKDCKTTAAKSVLERIAPIYAKRHELEANVESVWELLRAESKKAEIRAEETMEQVRDVFGIGRNLGNVGNRLGLSSSAERVSAGRDLRKFPALSDQIDHSNLDRISLLVQNHWLSNFVPSDIAITKSSDGQLLTAKKKRVLLVRYGQKGHQSWMFAIPPKSFEVWVLICDIGNWLEDFVIPQKYFSADFAYAKKAADAQGYPEVWVAIHQQGGDYRLQVHPNAPSGDGVDITNLRRNYEPLR